MINKIILVGRITKDPELSLVRGDIPLVKFNLAVNRNYINSSGVKEVDFIYCSAWRKQAENLAKYILKGALLGIEGSIRVDIVEIDNQKRYYTHVNCENIQFLESKKDNNKFISDNENIKDKDEFYFQTNNKNKIKENTNEKTEIIEEDELPF